MPHTSREWYDLHAAEYDSSYEDRRWSELYGRITWEKSIKPYLPANTGACILDAGGGTGIWTIRVAKLGYHVTLTDISQKMLDIAEEKLVKEGLLGKVRIVVADVTKMDMFEDNSFDFVLCEGDPLSYCNDPLRGIAELVRVAKRGAAIVASVDNLYSRVRWCLREGRVGDLAALLATQWVGGADGSLAGEFPMYNFRPEELVQRFEAAGCRTEKVIGKNIFSSGLGDRLKDPETFKAVLKLELEYCENPYLVGNAGHIAAVCRKLGSEIHS